MTTTIEAQLAKMIEPLLNAEGYDLVQLSIQGEGKGRILQILTEDPKTFTIDLESCARLSRTIGTHLEVEDILKGAYRLEISSPGIDRPLTRPVDYERYTGFEATITTHVPINNQRRYHGKILGIKGTEVTIETDTKTVTLDLADIAKSRLKLTDELIKFSRPAEPDGTATNTDLKGDDENDRTAASR